MIYHVIQGRTSARVYTLTRGVPCAVEVRRGANGVGWLASASADGDAQHVPTWSRDQAVACALDAMRILLTR